MTYQNVMQAPLDRMRTAADEWAALKGKLDTLTQDARSTMAAKAGDDSSTREAYLTVLHSVTLAVVRKLGCEDDAGLTQAPVLTEKKWRGER
ncbi:hypothetical protein [Streptomyces sp. NPDC004285]